MKTLSEEQIQEMIKLRTGLESTYAARDQMLTRYEEIYFMSRGERPKGLNIDENDIKETISSSGRDAVTGMKRILGTGTIHVDITKGNGGNPDKVESGLKRMLEISSEYKVASVEDDTILSVCLHGPGSLMVESVQDLIYAAEKGDGQQNEYVAAQLEIMQNRTPFLLHPVNAKTSYPMWGAYGMIGHLRKYTLKGSEITDKWGVTADPNKDYAVQDFFHYEKRLITAEGIKEPLMACEWVTRDPKTNKIVGSISIPVFTRYSGGTSLFHEPDKQAQPLLYAKAKGNWDLRENLMWTYLFTAVYQQGLPGPIVMLDPENNDPNAKIEVDFQDGIRFIRAKGQLADPQVIDGDVLQLKNLMDGQAAMQTVQPQTLGQNTGGVTFSQFALASKAGLIPAQDPKKALEALYRDAFKHILHRIKTETIDNDLISPTDIPEDFDIAVRLEPDMDQDDLRNAQVMQTLKNAGANLSDEYLNTKIMKVSDNKAMLREKAKEDIFKAMLARMQQNPELMDSFLMQALGKKPESPQAPAQGGAMGGMPPEMGGEMPPEMMQEGGPMNRAGMPMTDAMIPPEERQ